MRNLFVSLYGNDLFLNFSISKILKEIGYTVLPNNGDCKDKTKADLSIFVEQDNCKIDTFVDNLCHSCILIGNFNSDLLKNNLILEILPNTVSKQVLTEKLIVFSKLINNTINTSSEGQKFGKELLELQEQKELADLASKTKSFFLANVSHEIKTPLTGIKGFAEMLMDSGLNQEQRKYIEYVNLSVKRLTSIVSDVLDYTELESIGYKENEKAFYIGDTIANAASFVEIDAIHKNLIIETEVPENIPFCLVGDESRVRQIIVLLLNNAIKFTSKGKVKISVELAEDNKNFTILKFTVSDTGIGIKKEKLPFIFDRFYQIDESHNRKYGGLGLGLAIVKQLLDNMLGTIKVESEENKGTSFVFELPFKPHDAIVEQPKQMVSAEGKKILIVEDNPINMKIFKLILEKMGYTLSLAENGLIALQILDDEKFDLIFMDVQMPELNGLEATMRIREKELLANNHTPIVAFTAHSTSRDKEACLKAGMDDVLNKPIQKTALQNVLSKYIN
ncbi:MAG: response regulator [Bacteroidota bacterium]